MGSETEIPEYYWYLPLVKVSMAASAMNLTAIDGPYPHINDIEGYRKSCQWASILGCDGKLVLDPNEVAIANEVFSPTPDEATRAKLTVDTYEATDEPSTAQLDGRLIGKGSYEESLNIVTMARALQMLE